MLGNMIHAEYVLKSEKQKRIIKLFLLFKLNLNVIERLANQNEKKVLIQPMINGKK